MKKGDAIIYWLNKKGTKAVFGTVIAIPTEYSITVKNTNGPTPTYASGGKDLRWGQYYWKPATDMAKAIFDD